MIAGKPRNGALAQVPEPARSYLRHIESGQSLREIARSEGCHPSTILRRVRQFEARRDDPLFDAALAAMAGAMCPSPVPETAMTAERPDATARSQSRSAGSGRARPAERAAEEAAIRREARRVLRRLCEAGTVLAVAAEMDKAVVLKGDLRIGVTDRAMAEAFVMRDWIACGRQRGRVALYEITGVGRAALKRLLAEDPAHAGLAEAPADFASPYAEQHRVWGERSVTEPGEAGPRKLRYNMAESPLAVLARRREKDGTPFLSPDLVAAGERLREDFELAQMGPRVAQNWDRFLTAGDRGGFGSDSGLAEGPKRARDRVAAALRELGPGLGDMVLRCCCYLEGLEAAEQRLGWSARSGKIVLRIALMRLKRHYDETYGSARPMIG